MPHTPEPWEIEGCFDADVSVSIVHPQYEGDQLPITIAEIEPFCEDWSEEEIANVRLMRAAPKLLRCLKDAAEYVGVHVNEETIESAPEEWLAAIAEAEQHG